MRREHATNTRPAASVAPPPFDAPPGMWRSKLVRDLRSPQVRVEAFLHEPTASLSYLVYDDASRIGVVIDPVSELDPLDGCPPRPDQRMTAAIEALDIDLQYALETRVHCNHFTAASFLQDRYGAATAIAAGVSDVQRRLAALFDGSRFETDGGQFDVLVHDGDVLRAGPLRIEVVGVPGPPMARVGYRIGDASFVGDARRFPGASAARRRARPGNDLAPRATLQPRVFPGVRAMHVVASAAAEVASRVPGEVAPDSSARRAAVLRWNLCGGRPPDDSARGS